MTREPAKCPVCGALTVPDAVDESAPFPRRFPPRLCGRCRQKAGLPPLKFDLGLPLEVELIPPSFAVKVAT